jgi:hypothetical protein
LRIVRPLPRLQIPALVVVPVLFDTLIIGPNIRVTESLDGHSQGVAHGRTEKDAANGIARKIGHAFDRRWLCR